MQVYDCLTAGFGTRLIEFSDGFKKWPGGNLLLNHYIRRRVPAFKLFSLKVIKLQPGRCTCRLPPLRENRNDHFSIDEAAITALAIHTARLSLATTLPEDTIASFTSISLELTRSAHETLTATCQATFPKVGISAQFTLPVEITGQGGHIFARASVYWYVRPQVKDHALVG